MPAKLKLTDRMVNVINAHADITGIVQTYYPDYEFDGLVQCPFHKGGSEQEPSLHISPEGKAYCHSCRYRAGDIVELVANTSEIPYIEARQMLYHEVVNAIPLAQVYARKKALMKRPKAHEYLLWERNFSEGIIKDFDLGYDIPSDRIVIPVYDSFGTCVNMRRFAWKKGNKSKYRALNTDGHGENRLYPEHMLAEEDKILLVGGEWDVLCGRSFGLPCYSWTGGEGSWNENYNWLFKNKSVWVLYDNDEAGIAGQKAALLHLGRLPTRGLEGLSPLDEEKGKDLTDWTFTETGEANLEHLRHMIEEYVPRTPKINRGLCPCCGQKLPKGMKL